jgi:hypothetical protein
MKNKGLNILLIILIPWLAAASVLPEGKYKKTKVIRRSFQTNNTGELSVNNSYGNINVVTWEKNTVDIKVTIQVDGNKPDAVNRKLNAIDINFNQTGNKIFAKTRIEASYHSWSLFDMLFGKSDKVNFKILYEIRIPENFNLIVSNDYGNFYLDKLAGSLQLNLDYGQFDIGELSNDNNYIHTNYLSLSTIDFIKKGEINADYSKIKIGTAYRLNLNCDYTVININKVRSLHINNDYGSIRAYDVKEVIGTGDYQNRYFSGIDNLKFTGDYGSIKIDKILPGFRNIDIKSDYTNVKIINTLNAPYRLSVNQEYGNFKQNGINIYKDIQRNGDKTIEGYYQDKNSSSVIHIDMDYGSIKIINPEK